MKYGIGRPAINAETIFTLVIVGSVLLFYFLVYIPDNSEKVENERFRLLEQTIDKINFRIENYQQLLNNYQSIYNRKFDLNGDSNPGKKHLFKNSEQIQRHLENQIELKNKANENFIVNKVVAREDSISQKYLVASIQRSEEYLILHSNPADSAADVSNVFFEARVKFRHFFAPLLQLGMFSDYIIISTLDNSIIYESSPTGVRIFDYDSLFKNKNGILQPMITDIVCKGKKSKMFIQLAGHDQKDDWIIAGILPVDEYDAERMKLDPKITMILVMILIVFVLLLPWIKLLLLAKNEQIRTGDLLRAAISAKLIVITGTYLFISSDLGNSKTRIPDESYLENNSPENVIARTFSDSLRTELFNTYNILSEISSSFQVKHEADLKKYLVSYSVSDPAFESLMLNINSREKIKSMHFGKFFWLDINGREIAQLSKSQAAIPFGRYSERAYFQKTVSGQFQSFYDTRGNFHNYVFEPVYSWESDKYNLVMAIPQKDNKITNARVAALSVRFPSVEKLVLPGGFKFSVVDRNGTMFLHSDTTRILNDNILFFDDSEGNLKAALKTYTSKAVNTSIDNQKTRIYIKPVLNTPFFIAIFYDYSNTEIVDQLTMFKMGIMIVFLLLFSGLELLLVLMFHKRTNTRLINNVYSLSWIFPRTTQVWKYNFITKTNILLFLIMLAFMLENSFRDFLFVIISGTLLSTYYTNCVQIHDRNNPLRHEIYFGLWSGALNKTLLAFIFLVNAFSYVARNPDEDIITPSLLFTIISLVVYTLSFEYYQLRSSFKQAFISPAIWACLTLTAIILYNHPISALENKAIYPIFVLSAVLGLISSITNLYSHKNEDFNLKRHTSTFTKMLTSRLLITGALPVLAFYLYYYNLEQEKNVKSKLAPIAEKIISENLASDFPSPGKFKACHDGYFVKHDTVFEISSIELHNLIRKYRGIDVEKQSSQSTAPKNIDFLNNIPKYQIIDSIKQKTKSTLLVNTNSILSAMVEDEREDKLHAWYNFNESFLSKSEAAHRMNRMNWKNSENDKVFFNKGDSSSLKMLCIPWSIALTSVADSLRFTAQYVSSSQDIWFQLPFILNTQTVLWYALVCLGFYTLYVLIHYLVRTLFAAKLPSFIKYEDLHRKILENKDLSRLLYVSGLPGSGKTQFIARELILKKYRIKGLGDYFSTGINISSDELDKNKPWEEGVIIDLLLIPDTDDPTAAEAERWDSEVQKAMDDNYKVIIINHFEYNHLDHFTNRVKLNLLEALMGKSRKRIIIISSLDHQTFLSQLQERMVDPLTAVSDNTLNLNYDIVRWTTMLGHFTNIYIPLSDNTAYVEEVYKYESWRYIVNDECRYTTVLSKLKPELCEFFALHHNGLDEDQLRSDIISKIQNTVEQFYFALWHSLTHEEKLIVYDLAEEGLVNTVNQHAIFMLINKGVFRYEYGVLRLFNRSFRNFVLTSIGPLEAAKLETNIKSGRAWRRYKNPVAILLAGILFLVFFGDQERLNDVVIPFVSGMVAIVPLLIRLYSSIGRTESQKS